MRPEEKVQLIVSERVLTEMERNLQKKAPDQTPAYRLLLAALAPEIADEPVELIQTVETYVVPKDAPIVAAAIHAQVNYLVTYDRKHPLDRPEVAQQSGLAIVTPDVVVQAVRAELDTPKKPSE
jgi:predicted nucleic acid-binding protein